MDIGRVFDQIENTMRADFELARSAVRHEGIRGAEWEEVIRRFLRQYLPGGLEVSTGMLIDSHGNMTRQLDVVIYDAARAPVLYRGHAARVIPIEYAFAVIEVKSRIGKRELDAVFTNMASVYSLRSAPALKQLHYEQIIGQDAGNRLNVYEMKAPFMLKGTTSDYFPICYFLFSYDSIRLDTVARHIDAHCRDNRLPLYQRLDMVCVLQKGLICNKTVEGNDSGVPTPGSAVHAATIPRPLLAFYILLSAPLNQARSPNFDMAHYVNSVMFQQMEADSRSNGE